jgi:murein DD-endopeptidase MepM/ murein hydrolase activator NlpD
MKHVLKPVSLVFLGPLKTIGFVFLKFLGVPAYRAIFYFRRLIDRVLLPAKHRFFYLLSNRYTIHLFMIILVGIIGVTNFQTRNVRAETFGQKSVLYSLVSTDDSETVEVVEAGKSVLIPGGASSYLTDTILDHRKQFNQDSLDQGAPSRLGSTPAQIATARTRVETYTVQNGDTLGKISVRFNLSISTILSANGLTLRSTIRPGDTLKILPKDGIMYTIKKGDTLSKIASKYRIDASEITSANQLASSSSLKIGAEIILPGATETAPPAAIARNPVSVKDVLTNKTPASSQPVAVSKTGWVWPTTMHVITQYYSWKHTGLDVDADYGTFSIAARDGVVTYTGWRNGYGLTVEMDHGNGVKTRYAHNSKILVGVGDVVTAGTHLAKSGSTGRSTGTHLHFEIIINGKFVNPLSYVR